jgi:hypothetical protein
MVELGAAPQKAADVAALLDRTSPQVAPTRAELIAMGLLYTHEHGYDAFTVPHFESLMRRAMPDLQSRRFDAAAPGSGRVTRAGRGRHMTCCFSLESQP